MSVQYAIGIDIAKDQVELRWASQIEPRQISPSQSFANTEDGFQAAHAWLLGQGLVPASSLVVLEATGVYWEACALWFYAHQYAVSVVNPARVSAFAKTLMRRGKTDPLDARLLVVFALTLHPERWTPPAVEMESLQQIMRQRDAEVHLRSQGKNQLHALEHHAHPSPEVVASVRRILTTLDTEIAMLEAQFTTRLQEQPAWQTMLDRIMSVAGVGLVIAGTILTETNALATFGASSQLCAYAGITPVPFQSGTSVHRKERISKIGNPRLRKAMYQAAVCAIRCCAPFRTFYQRLLDHKKPKKVALVAVARKMLRVIFALVKQGTRFDPEYRSKSKKYQFSLDRRI
jgi:transposase